MTRLLLALFLMIVSLPAMAQEAAPEPAAEPIGIVAAIEGPVALARGAEAEAVAPQIGDEIFLNDIIETGPDARALVLFIDDTELTLGENARLAVDEYVFDFDAPQTNKARYSVLRGAFILASGLVGKRENPDVKIQTAVGTIGIRGTVVWGGVIDEEYNVFVQKGEVTFATQRGRVTVREGEGSKAASERAIPTRAKEWGEPKIALAVATVTLKDPEAASAFVASIKASRPNPEPEPAPEPEPQKPLSPLDTPLGEPVVIPDQPAEGAEPAPEQPADAAPPASPAEESAPVPAPEPAPPQQQRTEAAPEKPGPANAEDFETRELEHLGKPPAGLE